MSAVAPSDRMIQSKLLQSAEPIGDGSMEMSMSLGLMKTERYSEEDEIQPRGRRGSYTTTLTLKKKMNRRDPDVELTELGQPNTLQSLD